MSRKISMLAPEWWDYTTLDDDILNDAARLTPDDMQKLSRKGFRVVGMDNNLRRWFFGAGAATPANRRKLIEAIPLE